MGKKKTRRARKQNPPARPAANALKGKAWRIRIALRDSPKHALVDMPLVEFCRHSVRPRYLGVMPLRVELKELGNPAAKFVEVQ